MKKYINIVGILIYIEPNKVGNSKENSLPFTKCTTYNPIFSS